MRAPRASTLGAIGAILMVAHAAGAQIRVARVPDEPACPACSITVTLAARLGTSDGEGQLSAVPTAVRVDGRGRYWVMIGQRPLRVFDRSGAFLHSVGGAGSPAGRFRQPVDVQPLPGDSTLVLDAVGGNAVVLDRNDVRVRSIALGAVLYRLLPLEWPATVIGNGFVGPPSAGRGPLYTLSLAADTARVLRWFGSDSGARRAGGPRDLLKSLSASRSGGVWAADLSRYRIEEWTRAGERARTLVRSPAWFPDGKASVGGPATPPSPTISAIAQDSLGLLWVFVRTAAPTWKDAWPALLPGVHEVSPSTVKMERLFQTEVEVLDPAAGRVVARTTLAQWIVSAMPDRLAIADVLDADGIRRLHALRLDLTGYRPARGGRQ